MKEKNPSINSIVSYGLDTVDSSLTINVNLKDLLYVYKTLGELNRFFHQPLHYETINDVTEYMGNRDNGAYSVIRTAYYDILEKMFPSHINERIENGDFDNPEYPFYYDE